MPFKDPEKRREMSKIYCKKWRERHPDIKDRATMNWREKNWDRYLANNARYRNKYRQRTRDCLNAMYARRKQDPEYMAKRRELHEIYRNSPEGKAVLAKWKADHPDRVRELARAAHVKRMLIIRNGGHGTSTPEQFWAQCEFFGWRCAYCLKPIHKDNVEIDHIIPIAKGGSGWPSNLAPACRSCNSKKHAKRWLPEIVKPKWKAA